MRISKERIQNTIEFFSPKYGYTLSEEEARKIIHNLTEYFNVLNEIDATIKESSRK